MPCRLQPAGAEAEKFCKAKSASWGLRPHLRRQGSSLDIVVGVWYVIKFKDKTNSIYGK